MQTEWGKSYGRRIALDCDAQPAGESAARPIARPKLFDDLTGDDRAALDRLLSPVLLAAGVRLYVMEQDLQHFYIVHSGLVRLSIPLEDGRNSALGLIRAGGLLGATAALTHRSAAEEAVVLVPGSGWRLSANAVRDLAKSRPGVALALARHFARQVLNLQAELTCSSRHSLEKRLARVLQIASSELGRSRLPLTQDDLALTLGVQRTTITAVASRLKAAGAISYLRGVIRIVDPDRLMSMSCRCGERAVQHARRLSSA